MTSGADLSAEATTEDLDYRKGPRRRGEALERAILEAALAELTEMGYAGLTMERVAARARTSRSVLYRRWSSRAELVVDACKRHMLANVQIPDTGALRSDMIALLRSMSSRMSSPFGNVLRGLLADMLRSPELAQVVRDRFLSAGPAAVLTIVERAAARGEVPPGVLGSRRAMVATDLLRNEFVLYGAPVPDATIVEIVDDVYLPLVRA